MQFPFLLDETAILGIIGYFMVAGAAMVVLFMLLLGRVIFSSDAHTTGGKISRLVYLIVAGFLGLLLISFAL